MMNSLTLSAAVSIVRGLDGSYLSNFGAKNSKTVSLDLPDTLLFFQENVSCFQVTRMMK